VTYESCRKVTGIRVRVSLINQARSGATHPALSPFPDKHREKCSAIPLNWPLFRSGPLSLFFIIESTRVPQIRRNASVRHTSENVPAKAIYRDSLGNMRAFT